MRFALSLLISVVLVCSKSQINKTESLTDAFKRTLDIVEDFSDYLECTSSAIKTQSRRTVCTYWYVNSRNNPSGYLL